MKYRRCGPALKFVQHVVVGAVPTGTRKGRKIRAWFRTLVDKFRNRMSQCLARGTLTQEWRYGSVNEAPESLWCAKWTRSISSSQVNNLGTLFLHILRGDDERPETRLYSWQCARSTCGVYIRLGCSAAFSVPRLNSAAFTKFLVLLFRGFVFPSERCFLASRLEVFFLSLNSLNVVLQLPNSFHHFRTVTRDFCNPLKIFCN